MIREETLRLMAEHAVRNAKERTNHPLEHLYAIETPYQGSDIATIPATEIRESNIAMVSRWLRDQGIWFHPEENTQRTMLPSGETLMGCDNDGFVDFYFHTESEATSFETAWRGRMVNSYGHTL